MHHAWGDSASGIDSASSLLALCAQLFSALNSLSLYSVAEVSHPTCQKMKGMKNVTHVFLMGVVVVVRNNLLVHLHQILLSFFFRGKCCGCCWSSEESSDFFSFSKVFKFVFHIFKPLTRLTKFRKRENEVIWHFCCELEIVCSIFFFKKKETWKSFI